MSQHGFKGIPDFLGASLPYFTTHTELVLPLAQMHHAHDVVIAVANWCYMLAKQGYHQHIMTTFIAELEPTLTSSSEVIWRHMYCSV
jgi:hypothetical protein